MNPARPKITAKDFAFIIPTKDRPAKLKNLLDSMDQQTVQCGRILVIDGGESVEGVVESFADRLPVEYYPCNPPGQIRQRNMGISLLDERTPLVGSLDDDIVLEPEALESMVSFWNACEVDTAGVSFNIVNEPPARFSRLSCLLGLGAREPGRVLRSGMTTSNCSVSASVKTQWLCGGATVWRKDILERFAHREIPSRWAIAEDLIFSYPISKEYPLYVCADARVKHEHEIDYVSRMKHRFHGRTQTMWRFYFVESNTELSRLAFLWTLSLIMAGKCLMSIMTMQFRHLEFALGQAEGTVRSLSAILRGEDMATVLQADSKEKDRSTCSV